VFEKGEKNPFERKSPASTQRGIDRDSESTQVKSAKEKRRQENACQREETDQKSLKDTDPF